MTVMFLFNTRESKRKTPVAISFRGDDREFGENAVALVGIS